MERTFWENFKVSPALPEKQICIRLPNFALASLKPIFHGSEDLIQAFDRLPNNFIGNSDTGRTFLEIFKNCLAFPEKWFCIRLPNLVLGSVEPIFHGWEDSIWDFYRLQNNFVGGLNIRRTFLESLNVCFAFPEKWFFIR